MRWPVMILSLIPLTIAASEDAERVRTVMPEYREMLAVANDANDPEQVAANVRWMRDAFEARGFEVRRLGGDGPPLLLAQRRWPGNEHTHLIYLQADGQPVDPSAWAQDDPYQAVLKEAVDGRWVALPWSRLDEAFDPDWRVFARAASDAKGPIAMSLAALDEILAEGLTPTANLSFVIDFEEELGSPHLADTVLRHRQALAADDLLVFDGPPHTSGAPTLTFGARGIATLTLTVYGPERPVHSGHYGNWVPNPALRLAQLLAGMKDGRGRVTLPGFYDGVEIGDAERAAMAAVPDDEGALLTQFGIAEPDAVADSLQAALQYPSLNIRGVRALWVGERVRTLIPDEAIAEMDIRLVPGSDPEHLIGLVREHLEAEAYFLSDGPPTAQQRAAHPRIASLEAKIAYDAFRTPVDGPLAHWMSEALERAHGEVPVRVPMLGGSVPISPFIRALELPAVMVPTVNPDNNQHAPDENLRLGDLARGIATYRAVFLTPDPGR